MSVMERDPGRVEPASPPASGSTITTRSENNIPRRLRMTLALGDFEKAAKRHLPPAFFGYVAGAAEERASLVENRAAFAEPALVPRVLRDVNARSQATTLFGKRYALFVRTKAADQILQSVAEFCMRTSDSYHPHGLRLAGANCGHR